MIRFTTTILKFDKQGEKTGWSYLHIPADLAQQLKPGNRQAFRIKGKLDAYTFKGASLLPMGGGDFIMAFNAAMRKGTRKGAGAMIEVCMEIDHAEIEVPKDLAGWLEEDEAAKTYFYGLPKSHRNYWIKWLESVKTQEARLSRLERAVTALARALALRRCCGRRRLRGCEKVCLQDFIHPGCPVTAYVRSIILCSRS